MMLDCLTLAGFHIEAGARSFAEYSKRMVEDIGEGVRPFLAHLYGLVREYPGFDNRGMDDRATVDAELERNAEAATKAVEAQMADQPELETAAWINQEAAKYNRAGFVSGSARENDLLATWRRVRPEMCRRVGTLLPKLAFVLEMKCLESWKQYIKAGMPQADAELESTREWLLLEPES